MIFSGKVHKYGDNVNTDVIIPARYCNTIDPEKLAQHCMEDIDKKFSEIVKKGDILLAGENFGCGSSREVATIAIKASGISCVIAKSFSRIFYRNAVNIGLSVIECPEVVDIVKPFSVLEVDINKGTVRILSEEREFPFRPPEKFIKEIMQLGGLVNYIRNKQINV